MDKAFLDTTVLVESLLKVGPDHDAALAALKRYQETVLPVYAIKEWKAGQLNVCAYVHNKLVVTKSFSQTNLALSRLFMRPRWQSTAFEVWAMASLAVDPNHPQTSGNPDFDSSMADRLRLALRTMIELSWRKRRKITTRTVDDLTCYKEARPIFTIDGQIDLKPQQCDAEIDCHIAKKLKVRPDLLSVLRDAVPNSGRREDANRRNVLRKLIVHPNQPLTRKECRALGDAIFAFCAPADAEILTTNLRDLTPLAAALGKRAVKP